MDGPAPLLTTRHLRVLVPDPCWARAIVDFYAANRAHLEPWGPPFHVGMSDPGYWERHLAQNEEERRAGRSVKFLVAPPDADRVVGTINLNDVRRGLTHDASLGFALARDAEGRGWMTEAAGAVVDYAFGELGLHRLHARYEASNARSAAVLGRLGFEVEGVHRRSHWLRGAWRDNVCVARLAPDPDAPPRG